MISESVAVAVANLLGTLAREAGGDVWLKAFLVHLMNAFGANRVKEETLAIYAALVEADKRARAKFSGEEG